jgi:hypothetical protein
VDPSIKYGGGPDQIRRLLTQHSELVADLEEYQVMRLRFPKDHLNEQQKQQLVDRQKRLVQLTAEMVESVKKMIDWVKNVKGQEQ